MKPRFLFMVALVALTATLSGQEQPVSYVYPGDMPPTIKTGAALGIQYDNPSAANTNATLINEWLDADGSSPENFNRVLQLDGKAIYIDSTLEFPLRSGGPIIEGVHGTGGAYPEVETAFNSGTGAQHATPHTRIIWAGTTGGSEIMATIPGRNQGFRNIHLQGAYSASGDLEGFRHQDFTSAGPGLGVEVDNQDTSVATGYCILDNVMISCCGTALRLGNGGSSDAGPLRGNNVQIAYCDVGINTNHSNSIDNTIHSVQFNQVRLCIDSDDGDMKIFGMDVNGGGFTQASVTNTTAGSTDTITLDDATNFPPGTAVVFTAASGWTVSTTDLDDTVGLWNIYYVLSRTGNEIQLTATKGSATKLEIDAGSGTGTCYAYGQVTLIETDADNKGRSNAVQIAGLRIDASITRCDLITDNATAANSSASVFSFDGIQRSWTGYEEVSPNGPYATLAAHLSNNSTLIIRNAEFLHDSMVSIESYANAGWDYDSTGSRTAELSPTIIIEDSSFIGSLSSVRSVLNETDSTNGDYATVTLENVRNWAGDWNLSASYDVVIGGAATPRGGVFNVKDFGAKGDGQTDDTASIQAAVVAATGNGPVYFPPGVYLSDSNIYVYGAVDLIGEPGLSEIRLSADLSTDDRWINFGHPSKGAAQSSANDWTGTVRGLKFTADSGAANCNTLLSMASVRDGLVVDCYFDWRDASTACQDSFRAFIKGVNDTDWITGTPVRQGITVRDCKFYNDQDYDNGGEGVSCDGGSDVHFVNNYFYGVGDDFIAFHWTDNSIATGNECYGVDGRILVSNARNVRVTDNYITRIADRSGTWRSGSLIQCDLESGTVTFPPCENITITGNVLEVPRQVTAAGYGIRAMGVQGCQITGNAFHNRSQAQWNGIRIENSTTKTAWTGPDGNLDYETSKPRGYTVTGNSCLSYPNDASSPATGEYQAYTVDSGASTTVLTSASHGLDDFDYVMLFHSSAASPDLPAGLEQGVRYLVDQLDTDTFQLEDAGGNSVSFSDDGTGTQYWRRLPDTTISMSASLIGPMTFSNNIAFRFVVSNSYGGFDYSSNVPQFDDSYGLSGVTDTHRRKVATGTYTIVPDGRHVEIDSIGGAVTATLGSGLYIGQVQTIVMTDASNSSTVTVTNHETTDGEVGTFAAVDAWWTLIWTGTEWANLGSGGVTGL